MSQSESKRVVLASSNKGKLREINELLQGLHIVAVPQNQLGSPTTNTRLTL